MRNPFERTSDYFNNFDEKKVKNGNKNGKW